MKEYDPRSKPSSSELSWTTSLLLIGAAALVVFGGLALRRNGSEPKPPPTPAAELNPVVPTRPATAKRPAIQVSSEVDELRQKVEELERDRQAQDAEQAKSSQAAVELLARALAGASEGDVEEPLVELASGPFTKVSSTLTQVTFSLSNPGRKLVHVPLQVKLFRDGQEAGTKSMLAEIGPRELRAYSVLFQVDGPGNYAASVDLVDE